ncbi:hypothetical protein GJ700_03010 [Duganella sp. FT92W]|uniref:Lipoprotein n=1 Tax=Pseudoduganella rivuli TaxID=2666085 RepID=A0A7X2IIK2_9BURK|nr:hypothetical protein [Pseudoduganella rivuli]MRV70686.1 hypothetical protein [Pseudoduganella rivuli]
MRTLKTYVPALALVAAATGCQRSPIDVSEPKTYQYYMEHSDETKVVAGKCSDFEKKEFSVLPPSKQMAWRETPTGINCANARNAAATLVITEHQRGLAEAAAKYK